MWMKLGSRGLSRSLIPNQTIIFCVTKWLLQNFLTFGQKIMKIFSNFVIRAFVVPLVNSIIFFSCYLLPSLPSLPSFFNLFNFFSIRKLPLHVSHIGACREIEPHCATSGEMSGKFLLQSDLFRILILNYFWNRKGVAISWL